MTKYVPLIVVLCVAGSASESRAASGPTEVRKIEVWDQVVAKVNTEAISKRDVEAKMGEIAQRLLFFKKDRQANKQWNAEAETQWTQLYVEEFRKALRVIVRERLMLQHFAIEKMTLDPKTLRARQDRFLKQLRDGGIRDVDVTFESTRVKEAMMLETFKGKFDNELEFPKKPEVEKYYQDHIDKYQRKAAVKLRLIQMDISYTDKLTLVKKVREDTLGTMKDVRHDIAELGNLFSEVAKVKNDSQELRDRAGLVVGPDNDPYLVIDDFNKVLANATRNLDAGKISDVFQYGNGYAIALVEERREAGPIPLEGKKYEEIYNEMYERKKTKKEDEWFRATLAKTLVLQIVEGSARPLPIDFFFPDDKKNPDFVSDAPNTAKTDAKTDAKPDPKKNEKQK